MKVSFKKGFVLLLSLQFCLHVASQNVEYDLAKNIAVNFLAAKKGNTQKSNMVVSNEHTTYNSQDEALLYIFNFEEGGFVIVAADKRAEPILAYSKTNSFVMGVNPAAEYWVGTYADGIAYAKEMKLTSSQELQNTWEKAEAGNFSSKTQKAAVVEPLLTCKWNQDKYYNALCPDVSGALNGCDDRVPNGCVALAMAQIMYYHRYPYSGTSKSNYNCPGFGRLEADYAAANYNYEAMSDVATGYSNAIAQLCYHAGVSVLMNYAAAGSGTQSSYVPSAMQSRFKYKSMKMMDKASYTDAVWEDTIKKNLDRELPVYYSACTPSGAGSHGCHAFVCDGYDNSTPTMFHFNFGWGGYNDGFYTISSIPSHDNKSTYTADNRIIVGIEPSSPPMKSTGHEVLTATYGSFSDGSSPRVDYANNTNRSWLISPQNGRNVDRIILKTSYFSTEENNDVVTIYRGNAADTSNLVAILSGNMDTSFRIKASEVFVTFTSNGSNTDKGFLFTYTSERISSNLCVATMPSHTSPNTAASGTINSNNTGSGNYDDANECYWLLKPAGAIKGSVGLIFRKFDLAEGDFVELNKWNGTLGPINIKYPTHGIGRFTKEKPPIIGKVYKATDEIGVFVRFRTDNNLNKTGFILDWTNNDTTSVNEVQAGIESMSVYPNPAIDKVKIQIETSQPESVQISLYDIIGRKVSEISTAEAAQQIHHDIDVSNFAKGVYMLRITTSKGQITRKVVIQ